MKLAEIYSPELYSAQAELQTAAAALRAAENGGRARTARRANLNRRPNGCGCGVWTSSRSRQSRTANDQRPPDRARPGRRGRGDPRGDPGGLRQDRRDALHHRRPVQRLGHPRRLRIRRGLAARRPAGDLHRAGLSGPEFPGDILFIDPVLDERTRTVEVRVVVDNSRGPAQTGHAGHRARWPSPWMPTVVRSTDPATAVAPLVIPASAPLLTGDRAVVYVRRPGPGDPVFPGRRWFWGRGRATLFRGVGTVRGGRGGHPRQFQDRQRPADPGRTSMMNPGPAEIE